MGSPFSFECRRQELQEMGLPSSDDDVTQSYLSLIHPGGLLCKYLQYAKMALVVEDTIFVHGALNEYYLGWVPPKRSDNVYDVSQHSEVLSDAVLWMERINEFAKIEVADFVQNTEAFLQRISEHEGDDWEKLLWDVEGGYGHDQPGSRLIQCGMGTLPDKSMNPSIIYSSYLENGRPVTISPRTYTWLSSAHWQKVVVGHQPNGDAPLIVNNYHHQKYVTVSF